MPTAPDAGDLLTLNHDLSGSADDVQYTLGYTNAHQLASEVSSKSSYNFPGFFGLGARHR